MPRLTSTVRALLIGLGAAFVVLAIVQNVAGFDLYGHLALDLRLEQGFMQLAWQPLTFWFVYPPVPDALLNYALLLLGIYFFLSPFEEAFGRKRTIQLAAAGIAGSAIGTILLALALLSFPSIRPPLGIAGPSPIALAALGAFPVVLGNRQILFMFVIPMKAWTVILIGLGMTALAAVLARDPFVFVDHAGALGAGVAFARWMTRPRGPRRPKSPPKGAARRPNGPHLEVVRGGADPKRGWLN
jgi:membrane associated rhomboid family serine protease